MPLTNPVGMRVFIAPNPHQHLVSFVILILANMTIFPLVPKTQVPFHLLTGHLDILFCTMSVQAPGPFVYWSVSSSYSF